jgi:hypothetical protein
MLSSDEMIVTLSVPGRSRSIQAKDFTGVDTASVGLVRRVEDMVTDTPHYRDELSRRHGHALTRIGELEAVADAPFEHTDAVRDKRHRLDTLTAQLQMSADSPEAKAKETEHQQRLDAQGREPGWSLALNPTPALRAELGDAELARRAGHGGGGLDTRGFLQAVRLEEEVAVNPRVLLDEDCADLAREEFNHGGYSDKSDSPYGHLLLRDEDARTFVNYLVAVSEDAEWEPDVTTVGLLEHKKRVEEALAATASTCPIHAKYQWLGAYHNFICTEFYARTELRIAGVPDVAFERFS